MVRIQRSHTAVFLLLVLLAVPFTLSGEEITEEANPCPIPGQIPITADMRDEVRALGIRDDQTCWNPGDKNIGLGAAEAKKYLRSILCARDVDNYGGAGPEETITRLNSGFAVCAAKFLKIANAQVRGSIALRDGGTAAVCVNEGYRTNEKQLEYWRRYMDPYKACDPTNKPCEHTTGLAIDVNTSPTSNYPLLWQLGSQHGVNFYLREKDPYHFRASNQQCVSTGALFDLSTPVGGSISTGGTIPANTFDFPPQATAQQNPYAAFGQQFIQLLGPLMQSFGQPAQSGAQPATNPAIPLSSPVAPITNALATDTQNPSPSGGNGSVPNPLTNPIGSNSESPVSIPASGRIPTSSTPTITNPLSASDTRRGRDLSPLATIEMLAGLYPGESAPTGESLSPAQVNEALNNAHSPDEPVVLQASSTGVLVPQTFTSSDLRYSPRIQTLSNARLETTRFSALLSQLQSGLVSLISTPITPRASSEIGVWSPTQSSYNR